LRQVGISWEICQTAGKTTFFRNFRPVFWRRNWCRGGNYLQKPGSAQAKKTLTSFEKTTLPTALQKKAFSLLGVKI
jgi:hypothetical protein